MLEDLTKSKPFDTLAAIGIALPITADWKPSKTKPEILFSNKDAKFFPPNSQLAEADYIWIPYTLTPSIYQERIQRYIYQFILLLVAPFMGLLFINEDDIKKPKARRTIILILSGGAIIAGWFLFGLYKGILGSEGVDMLANLSLAILGAILTPLPAWIKSKKSTS